MGKMSLQDLRSLRDARKNDLRKRDVEGKVIQVIIGMGTCGIAAGGKDIVNAFMALVDEHNAKHDLIDKVMVRQVGCMGLCHSEPTVEVLVPGMPDIIYGKVDTAVAREIVEKHIIGGKLLDGRILDRPAVDIAKV